MKIAPLWIAILSALLMGCGKGSEDKPAAATTTQPQATNAPNVAVPATAHLSDYECTDLTEFTDAAGAPQRTEAKYKGTVSFWKENGFSLVYDEESAGDAKTLSRYQKVGLEDGKYRQTGTSTSWLLREDKWTKVEKSYVRLWQKQGNVRRVLENQENGVSAPYEWEFEESEIDARTSKSVQRHLNPASRNREGRNYTRIEIQCTETDRQ